MLNMQLVLYYCMAIVTVPAAVGLCIQQANRVCVFIVKDNKCQSCHCFHVMLSHVQTKMDLNPATPILSCHPENYKHFMLMLLVQLGTQNTSKGVLKSPPAGCKFCSFKCSPLFSHKQAHIQMNLNQKNTFLLLSYSSFEQVQWLLFQSHLQCCFCWRHIYKEKVTL